MGRVYNFSAGPSCLPEEVLHECADEMMNFNGTGQSVMEMSHRSKAFEPIICCILYTAPSPRDRGGDRMRSSG